MSSQNFIFPGHNYALFIGRSLYDNELALDPLSGVASTARNTAVDLVRNGFNVLVLTDTPMALSQPGFNQPTLEEKYIADADHATKQTKTLHWTVKEKPARKHILAALEKLETLVPGHHPSSQDQLIVYICSHGLLNAKDNSYGAALGDTLCTASRPTLPTSYDGAYTMAQLKKDLGVDSTKPWRNVFVVLDTCFSGDAFDATKVSLRARGNIETDQMQWFYQSESYQCLAGAPCGRNAFCLPQGTTLHTALRRAWLSPFGDGGAFAREKEGAAQWATVRCLADRVNEELAAEMKRLTSTLLKRPDVCEPRQTCLLGRLPWRCSHNTGEFIVFNKNYKERNKLEMIPVLPTCFTGRTAQLAELHSRLMSDRHPAIGNNIAVSAAGGMGKSAMAAMYSTQYVNDYTWLLWVRGSNAGTMVASFRAAAAYIPLSEVTSATKDEEVVVMIRRWLGHENGWLMVVDGWDTVTKEMVAMLPMGQTAGDIIITTRLHSLCDFGGLFGGGVGGGSGTPLFLDVLEDDEALDYLLERLPTRREESEGLRKVVVSLGKMPLALELASAYLSKFETVSVSAYLKKLRVDRLNALQNLRTGDGEVVNQVLATYVPSIVRALETESQDMVKKIVSVIGFVDGSGVEADLLRLLVVRRRHGEEEGAGEDDFDMALSVLRGLSVLKVKGKSVSVHELVQDVCRTMAFASEEDRWKVLLGIGTALKEEIEDVEKIYSAMEWSRKLECMV